MTSDEGTDRLPTNYQSTLRNIPEERRSHHVYCEVHLGRLPRVPAAGATGTLRQVGLPLITVAHVLRDDVLGKRN